MNLLEFYLYFPAAFLCVTEIVDRDVKPQFKIQNNTGLCCKWLILQLHINIHTRHTVHICVFQFNGGLRFTTGTEQLTNLCTFFFFIVLTAVN